MRQRSIVLIGRISIQYDGGCISGRVTMGIVVAVLHVLIQQSPQSTTYRKLFLGPEGDVANGNAVPMT